MRIAELVLTLWQLKELRTASYQVDQTGKLAEVVETVCNSLRQVKPKMTGEEALTLFRSFENNVIALSNEVAKHVSLKSELFKETLDKLRGVCTSLLLRGRST